MLFNQLSIKQFSNTEFIIIIFIDRFWYRYSDSLVSLYHKIIYNSVEGTISYLLNIIK